FSSDIPTTAARTVIRLGEHIPHLQNLYPILREMEKVFSDGARSVSLVLNVDGQHRDFQLHFSKVCRNSLHSNYFLMNLSDTSTCRHP
ncbi:hypothetical protein B0H14DRAFT_2396282, partial [Mycena olivaceomarginata]